MNYESKWQRKTLGSGYNEDNTVGMDREESPLKRVIIAGAIAAGGVAAYKSGALKGVISKMIDSADNYRPIAKESHHILKQWVEDRDHTSPTFSLLRSRFTSKKGGEYGPKLNPKAFIKNEYYRNEIFRDTLRDVDELKADWVEQMKRFDRKHLEKSNGKSTLWDTDLARHMRSLNETASELKKTKENKATVKTIKGKLTEELMDFTSQSEQSGRNQFKRTGYRKLTLGDIFDFDSKTNKPFLKLEYTGKLDADTNKFVDSLGEFLRQSQENTYTSSKINDYGKKITKSTQRFEPIGKTNNWKNMEIDKNLMINEQGKIVDTRGASSELNSFVHTMANDFQVPVIGINPLRLFGVGNKFYQQDKFGILYKNTVQPMVTHRAGHQATVGNQFQDSLLFFANDKLFELDKATNKINTFDGQFKFHNLSGSRNYGSPSMAKRRSGLTNELHTLHSMANLDYHNMVDYNASDSKFNQWKGKVGKWLDVGRQEHLLNKKNVTMDGRYDQNFWKMFEDESIFNYFQPDFYVNKSSEFFGRTFKTYKELGGNNFNVARDDIQTNITHIFGSAPEKIRQFETVKKRYNPLDDGLEKSLKQLFVGRDKDGNIHQDVTELTLAISWVFNRPMQSLSAFGLDLSNESKGSTLSTVKNAVLKRFLPVYGAYQAYEFINMFGPDLNDDGSPENLTKLGAEGVKMLDIGYHKIKDVTGLTAVSNTLAPLLPGIDQLPGGDVLDMDGSTDERMEWYKNGYAPVRKGRWWALGNTPFTGGRIEYWQPNWYRRVQADANFSDSLYGSRQEYFLSKLNPYHYDQKHYQDRPYLMTSGLFQNVPFFGPVLDSTVGKVIKPQRKMHLDVWKDLEQATKISQFTQPTMEGFDVETELGIFPEKAEKEEFVAYTTPSGNSSLVGIGSSSYDVPYLNKGLKSFSLRRLAQVNTRPVFGGGGSGSLNVSESPLNPESSMLAATEIYKDLSNFTGMVGFLVNDFVLGDMNVERPVIETSEYAYSFNRQFWNMNIGGMGGDLMEIFRRFIPQRRKDVEWVNPIRNTMPTWLPGSNYFTDFQHGDPYTKVSKGELRLPGEGYERLHGIDLDFDMGIGSSYLGKSKSDIIKHFLKEDAITDPYMQDILDTGTEMHEKVEKELEQKGIAINTEGQVKDVKHNVIGYYDVLMHDPSSPSGVAVMDIKTIGDKGFQSIKSSQQVKQSHQVQVNFYLKTLGLEDSNGYITYINRDNPEEVMTLGFQYDEKMYQASMDNLESAREDVLNAYRNGEIGRGSFYSHIDRYRILADVAPYSKEFTEQKKIVNSMDLTDEQKAEIKAINERVTKQKEAMRIYPYRFKTSNVEKETVTVKKVLDADTFITKEYPNNPIRLAGINANSQPNEEGKTIQDVYHRFLKPGQKVQIAYDYDAMNKYSTDSYDSIRASVTSKGKNLNRLVVKEGFATENEDDYSPASVHARFNGIERTFGSIWETGAHLNTPFNTKMLQVRSGYESYILREVYGKDFQSWAHPIKDWMIPIARVNIERESLNGVVWGGIIGAMFGSNKTGRLIGAAVGATSVATLKMAVGAKEMVTGKKWIPKVRQEERDLEEYIDHLKYVKNRRLYEEYRRKAFFTEGFDVESYLNKELDSGDKRDRYKERLSAKKKELKLSDNPERVKKNIDDINEKLNDLNNKRKIKKLGANATKAVYYYEQSEKTVYGYDVGEPLTNILAALPKKERQYMKYFLDAPEEERGKILQVVPDYLKRILQATWGYKPDPKESLEEYFTKHYLPDEDWIGWQENVNMDAVRVKLIKKADLDFSEFDVWEDDIKEANAYGEIPLPKLYHRESTSATTQRLKQLLGKRGLKDIQIEVSQSANQSGISISLTEDVRPTVQRKLKSQISDE